MNTTKELLTIRAAQFTLKALTHKLRQQMILFIQKNAEVTVTQIYSTMLLEQSVTSQHLGILRRAGIITATRAGKFVYYSVNAGRVDELARLAAEIVA